MLYSRAVLLVVIVLVLAGGLRIKEMISDHHARATVITSIGTHG